jgi:hypothetical protein
LRSWEVFIHNATAFYYIILGGHADMNEKIRDELDRIVDTLANTGIVSRLLDR